MLVYSLFTYKSIVLFRLVIVVSCCVHCLIFQCYIVFFCSVFWCTNVSSVVYCYSDEVNPANHNSNLLLPFTYFH
jgi:hypothetical protein